jgi:hypothetical protein
MKFALLFLSMFIAVSTQASAAQSCNIGQADIIYKSATSLGHTLVILEPRVRLAEMSDVPIGLEIVADDSKQVAGTNFCTALGYRNGRVGDVERPNQKRLAAFFNEAGAISSVESILPEDRARFIVATVTCQK